MDKITLTHDFQTKKRKAWIINLESKAYLTEVYDMFKSIVNVLKKAANDE
jgi:hypothetical protein